MTQRKPYTEDPTRRPTIEELMRGDEGAERPLSHTDHRMPVPPWPIALELAIWFGVAVVCVGIAFWWALVH